MAVLTSKILSQYLNNYQNGIYLRYTYIIEWMLINSLFRFRGGEVQYTFVFEPEFLPATGSTTINGQYDDARKKVVKIYVVLLQIHLNFNTL